MLALVLIAAVVAMLVPTRAEGARRARRSDKIANADPELQGDAREFIQRLIEDFGYTDLARMWIAERLESAPPKTKGDLEYFLCDCERVDGNLGKMGECLERTAARYPRHPRSLVTRIISVEAKLAEVIQLSNEARAATDEATRKQLLVERDALFQESVLTPINDAVTSAGEPKTAQQSRLRQSWLLLRVRAHQLYAERLEADDPRRVKALEKAHEYAVSFVEDDADAFDLACRGQLLRGNVLAALGKYAEAAEMYETLVGIEPFSGPPHSDEVKKFIVNIRLQASQGMAEAYVQAGKPEKAIEVFENKRENDPFGPDKIEDQDSIQALLLKSRISEGIVRLAGGDAAKGGQIFDDLIAQYDSPRFTATQRKANEPFRNEVHVGLSRALDAGVRGLTSEQYYRAGLGYKARYEFDRGIGAWRLAVAAGAWLNVDEDWVARSLYEIAESSLILDRREEAVVTYMLLLETFRSLFGRKTDEYGTMASKAAQNAYATVSKLAEGERSVWTDIEKQANKEFTDWGKGEARLRNLLGDAVKDELKGKYDEARKRYLDIPREAGREGEKQPVSFYFRARAGAARCLFRAALTGGGDVAAAQVQAATELQQLYAAAKAAKDIPGAASVLVEWGRIYWPAEQDKEQFRDAEKAIAALKPLGTEIRGNSEYREAGLRLWMNILVAQDKLVEAGKVFDYLHREFAGGPGETTGAITLIEAHTNKGSDQDNAEAARYALLFMESPGTNIEELKTEELLWFATKLMNGGNFKKALELIQQAQKTLGDMPEPAMAVLIARLLGQAANKAGEPQKCLDTLKPVYEQYLADIKNGVFEDAPFLVWEMAKAEIALHKQDRKSERLDRALEYLLNACGILQARRASLRPNPPPELNLAYWNCELQRLRVLEAQQKMEHVCKEISTFRMMAGNKDFAPESVMPGFKKLEDKCQ